MLVFIVEYNMLLTAYFRRAGKGNFRSPLQEELPNRRMLLTSRIHPLTDRVR